MINSLLFFFVVVIVPSSITKGLRSELYRIGYNSKNNNNNTRCQVQSFYALVTYWDIYILLGWYNKCVTFWPCMESCYPCEGGGVFWTTVNQCWY